MVDTAIMVAPEVAVTVEELSKKVLLVLDYAKNRSIVTVEDAQHAVDDIASIVALSEAIESKRKEFQRPYTDKVDAIRALFKKITVPLEEARTINRDKYSAYLAEQKRIQAEAEAINLAKQELAKREMVLNGEVTVNTTPVPVVQAPEKTTGMIASAGGRKKAKWKVTDFGKIPDQYKTTDDKRIQKAVDAGAAIEGIEVSWEEILVIRKKG